MRTEEGRRVKEERKDRGMGRGNERSGKVMRTERRRRK